MSLLLTGRGQKVLDTAWKASKAADNPALAAALAGSRAAAEAAAKAQAAANKVLTRPSEPGPEDCCQSGCTYCVWEIYQQDLEAFQDQERAKKEKAP